MDKGEQFHETFCLDRLYVYLFFPPQVDGRKVESSIWRQIGASVQAPPIQVKLFETLFKNTPAITAVAKSSAAASSGEIKLANIIDPKRSQNLMICLKKIKLPVGGGSVLMRDFNLLLNAPLDDLKLLKELRPTAEEEQLLRSFEGPDSALSQVELFMQSFISVAHVNRRLEACEFMRIFDSSLADVGLLVSVVAEAAVEIMSSEQLQLLLAMTLIHGNFMNTGAQRYASAVGFTLDGLDKLAACKSADNKTNLLRYFLDQLSLVHPGFVDAYTRSMSTLSVASKVQCTNIDSEFSKLQSGLDACTQSLHVMQEYTDAQLFFRKTKLKIPYDVGETLADCVFACEQEYLMAHPVDQSGIVQLPFLRASLPKSMFLSMWPNFASESARDEYMPYASHLVSLCVRGAKAKASKG